MENSEYTVTIDDTEPNALKIDLGGTVSFDTVELLLREIQQGLKPFAGEEVVVALDKVDYLDSAGTAMLAKIRRMMQEKGGRFTLGACSKTAEDFLRLSYFDRTPEVSVERPRIRGNPLESAGKFALQMMKVTREIVYFVGELAQALLWNIVHPWRVKWREVLYLTQRTGADALPIVGLLSLLIGLVSAFSSAVQLRQFGANIYIADLVGIGMTREMGPLITAIILTGRSGSAFAAEIGTMKISDEIDALTIMGVKPMNYLVVPRVLAVMLIMPFLTLFSDVFGILGGLFISISSLNLTPLAFMNELQSSIGLWDVGSGLLKSLVYGILVAGAGCYCGLQTIGGALNVGKSTTASVVSGIVLIVATDSIFAIVLHYLDLD